MRKIKNFKLSWRVKEIARRAKKAGVKLADIGLGDDDSLALFLESLNPKPAPAVLFDSFSAKADETTLAPLPGLAYSLGLATLGPFEEALASLADAGQRKVAAIAAKTALDQALQFAGSLIAEEAAAEKCELSPLQPLEEPAQLAQLLDRLDGSKIGVALRDAGIQPSFTTAFSISWIARPKSRARR